jgi:cullin-4
MQDELKRFTDFYATKHKNHRLYWHHLIGTAILKAQFDAGSKDLTVGLYQAVVLLLFNDTDELSYRDIKAQTNMVCGGDTHSGEFVADEPELKRTLQSLACGKKKVLRKSPPGRDVDETDVFRFNADYTDPHARVHINSVQVKETVSPRTGFREK